MASISSRPEVANDGGAGAGNRPEPKADLVFGGTVRPRLRVHHWPLAVRVYWEAFRSAPLQFLQGAYWRARGLKVRSRNRIAALAGRSRHAYALWIARDEPALMALSRPLDGLATFVALTDASSDPDLLDCTLGSIEAAGGANTRVLAWPRPGARLDESDIVELNRLEKDGSVWIFPVTPGDELAPRAFAHYSQAASDRPDASVIYADDDEIGEEGERRKPHLKPDWNPELFKHHDYVSGACIYRWRPRTDCPAGDVASALKGALSSGAEPAHLPRVLHHRRARPQPVVPGRISPTAGQPMPSVTVIIPTRNQAALLRLCVAGVLRVDYPRPQLIIVDNGTDEPAALAYLSEIEGQGLRVLRCPGPFNYSALNNAAVRHADGELLCFLNNDVEMLDDDWLRSLALRASPPDAGAVGARLLYPDRTIQHAGVFTGIGGGAGHGHRFQPVNDPGYFQRASLPQQVSAVTAACLVVARDKFLTVGGFDEVEFPVAFNDVDLCLKLNQRGWQTLYEPRATLIHHESKSRGSDSTRKNRDRFAGELRALKSKWRTHERRDPFHHPQLSPFTEQFLISI